MYEHKIHYCFTLSEEQMKYLRSKKYKIDRMVSGLRWGLKEILSNPDSTLARITETAPLSKPTDNPSLAVTLSKQGCIAQ